MTRTRLGWTAQQGTHSGEHLEQFKRFDHVIVTAIIERPDAILQRITRRQEQNRTGVPGGSSLTCEDETAVLFVQQAHVQDHQVGFNLEHHLAARRQVMRDANLETLCEQGALQRQPDVRFIFNQEDAHLYRLSHMRVTPGLHETLMTCNPLVTDPT